ncbi:hypothetical protein AN642_02130 [Epulopiscium sp. SCG-B10WGA-EpuloA2]|nr:hypothetical protein AN642_02130 [Epulopiscium sp. SCG-B10WGA-EpuloA2]
MKNIKLLLLSLFIGLSIFQTFFLWLGGPLSHIFFNPAPKTSLIPISPKYIWINTGGAYTKGLKISNKEQEYNLMVEELQSVLFKAFESKTPDFLKKGNMSELYNQRGLIYEYSIPLSIDEIVGKSVPLKHNYKIDYVFIHLKDEILAEDSIYFINETDNYYVEMALPNKAHEFENIYFLFNNAQADQNTSLKYQPSIKDIKSPHIKGNVFFG